MTENDAQWYKARLVESVAALDDERKIMLLYRFLLGLVGNEVKSHAGD